MSGINIPLSISDGMSSPFDNMIRQVQRANTEFGRLRGTMEAPLRTSNIGLSNMNNDLRSVNASTRSNARSQEEHNRTIGEGNNIASKLKSTIKSIGGAYLGLQGLKKIFSLGDVMAGNEARLKMINDGKATTLNLDAQIYAMAKRTNSSYLDTMATVNKLGMLTKDAWSSNDEMLAFTEGMNKMFKTTGASAMEQSSAMYQLTQALASGALQGDEFRSIRENAPMLAQYIQKELNGIDLKEASKEGLMTVDVIKRAILNNKKEIDEEFKRMPKTLSSIATNMVTDMVTSLAPLGDAMSRLWNNESFIRGTQVLSGAFRVVGIVGAKAFDGINAMATFTGRNIQWIRPIVLGVVGAFVLWKSVTIGITVAQGIYAGAMAIGTTVTTLYTMAVGGATVATQGFNMAMLMCPITWIVAGVIAVITAYYALVGVYNRVTKSNISATGLMCGALFTLVSVGLNTVKMVGNGFSALGEFLANVFSNPCYSMQKALLSVHKASLQVARGVTRHFDSVATNIANAFIGGANMAITAINWITKALNKIPGINIGEMGKLSKHTSITHSIDNQIGNIDSWIEKNKPKNYKDFKKFEYANLDESASNGYKFGEGLVKKFKGFFNPDQKTNQKEYDVDQMLKDMPKLDGQGGKGGKGGKGKKLKEIAKNTKDTAENTANSRLDVKYLRQIAERTSINKFTTAQINIENNVSQAQTQDLDGFVDTLTTKLEEKLEIQTEGYYS